MPDMPADGWFIARNREQDGPFTAARLKQLSASGWLGPDDLVWHASLSDWTPARDVAGLFGGTLAHYLRTRIPGLRRPARPVADDAPAAAAPHAAPRRRPRRHEPGERSRRWRGPAIDFGEIGPRHLLAMCGALLAALGIAFAFIRSSPLVWPFIAGGLAVTMVALLPECGRLLVRATLRLDALRQQAAERRLQTREEAREAARLEAEAAHREAEHRAAQASWSTPVRPERLVVIHAPPVKRWSPLLALLLSIVLPGLGHVYKQEKAAGIGWFLAVAIAYSWFFGAGVILHLCCITSATGGNPWTEGETRVVRES